MLRMIVTVTDNYSPKSITRSFMQCGRSVFSYLSAIIMVKYPEKQMKELWDARNHSLTDTSSQPTSHEC